MWNIKYKIYITTWLLCNYIQVILAMSVVVPQTPGTFDIFNIPNAYAGLEGGPDPGNFGISGPNVPMVEWAPRGDNVNQTSPAGFLQNGQAPRSHGHITLKSWDFIQYQYTIAPWGDESHMELMDDVKLSSSSASTL